MNALLFPMRTKSLSLHLLHNRSSPTHSSRSLVMGLRLQSLYSQHLLEPAGEISIFLSSRFPGRLTCCQKNSNSISWVPNQLSPTRMAENYNLSLPWLGLPLLPTGTGWQKASREFYFIHNSMFSALQNQGSSSLTDDDNGRVVGGSPIMPLTSRVTSIK